MAVCKWYLPNIRCFFYCVQIFEHFLNAPRLHFHAMFYRWASDAKIAQKMGKKFCKPSFQRLASFLPSIPFKRQYILRSNVYFRLIPPFSTSASAPSAVQTPFLILPVNSQPSRWTGRWWFPVLPVPAGSVRADHPEVLPLICSCYGSFLVLFLLG